MVMLEVVLALGLNGKAEAVVVQAVLEVQQVAQVVMVARVGHTALLVVP